MSLTITTAMMISSHTTHTAQVMDADGWEVSWLPGRRLTQNQAITAMTIAEVVATRFPIECTDPLWDHLDNWAAELGLTGPNAVARASESPELRAWWEGR